MKYCTNCGTAAADDTMFCSNCGAKLENTGYEGYSPVQQKKSPLIPILIAAVVIVAIIVAGVVAISLSKNKTAPQEPISTVTQATEPETTAAPETTTQQETTTQPPTTQESVQKVYIYQGYMGGASEGYEYIHDDGYLFPSDREYLTYDYLNTLTRDQIAFLRNEIYARHGYIFRKSKFRNYFNAQSWYVGYEPDMATVEKSFNKIENKNISTLVKYEKNMGWR